MTEYIFSKMTRDGEEYDSLKIISDTAITLPEGYTGVPQTLWDDTEVIDFFNVLDSWQGVNEGTTEEPKYTAYLLISNHVRVAASLSSGFATKGEIAALRTVLSGTRATTESGGVKSVAVTITDTVDYFGLCTSIFAGNDVILKLVEEGNRFLARAAYADSDDQIGSIIFIGSDGIYTMAPDGTVTWSAS